MFPGEYLEKSGNLIGLESEYLLHTVICLSLFRLVLFYACADTLLRAELSTIRSHSQTISSEASRRNGEQHILLFNCSSCCHSIASVIPIAHFFLPASDFFPCVKKHINHRWQTLWQSFPNNKLYKIHSSIDTIPPINSFNCKDQVLINRLMNGHTRLSHFHLLSKEPPPMCIYCSTLLTVEHILTNCSHYQTIRHKYYQYSDLSNIFQVIPKKSLISFIKEINLYHQF